MAEKIINKLYLRNTDPTMVLPEGKTCGMCAHWQRCSALIHGLDPKGRECDFSPSRFLHGEQNMRQYTRKELNSPSLLREMAILMKYWRNGGDSFGCLLFALITKADYDNRELLRKVYPYHVLFFEDWQAAPDGDAFLERAMR